MIKWLLLMIFLCLPVLLLIVIVSEVYSLYQWLLILIINWRGYLINNGYWTQQLLVWLPYSCARGQVEWKVTYSRYQMFLMDPWLLVDNAFLGLLVSIFIDGRLLHRVRSYQVININD